MLDMDIGSPALSATNLSVWAKPELNQILSKLSSGAYEFEFFR